MPVSSQNPGGVFSEEGTVLIKLKLFLSELFSDTCICQDQIITYPACYNRRICIVSSLNPGVVFSEEGTALIKHELSHSKPLHKQLSEIYKPLLIKSLAITVQS